MRLKWMNLTVIVLAVGCAAPEAVPILGQCGPIPEIYQPDMQPCGCTNLGWLAPACAPATLITGPNQGEDHILLPTAITYTENPPMSGNHRGDWAKFGEYEFLPPQRWLHNLEHGAIAFLYNPCAPGPMVEQLREFARHWDPGDGSRFRWVLTPYQNLPTPIAIVAWRWRAEMSCFDATTAHLFVKAHYLQAPENVGAQGSYELLWLGDGATATADAGADAR